MDDMEFFETQDYPEPEQQPEPEPIEPSEPKFTEPEPEPEPEPAELKTDWGITEDGEIEFSDDFLSDTEKNLFPNRTPEEPEQGQPTQQSEPQPEQPQYYTPEELANTPYEQWDINRLNGDVKNFVPIVQQQIAQRQAYAQAQAGQRQAAQDQLSNYIPAPVQYSPKELAEAAQKLAVEKLGLESPEEFDEYEVEHRAALSLAMQELSGQRQSEIANYQRASGEYQQLQNFNRQLASQPDFKEFYTWYEGKLKARKLTPQMVNDALWNNAVNNGGNFSYIAGLMGNWYREFRQTKATRPKAQKPPTLESTRGKSYEGTGGVNLSDFGDMDSERQAQTLIKMGIV